MNKYNDEKILLKAIENEKLLISEYTNILLNADSDTVKVQFKMIINTEIDTMMKLQTAAKKRGINFSQKATKEELKQIQNKYKTE